MNANFNNGKDNLIKKTGWVSVADGTAADEAEEISARYTRAVPREVRDILSDTASLAIDHGAGPKPGRRSHNRSILQRAASAKTFDSRWDVKTGLNVPTSFRLDRPVQIDRTETQVASAMADYLRAASISARFDDEKAEALGATFGGTQFAIRLFKADDPGVYHCGNSASRWLFPRI